MMASAPTLHHAIMAIAPILHHSHTSAHTSAHTQPPPHRPSSPVDLCIGQEVAQVRLAGGAGLEVLAHPQRAGGVGRLDVVDALKALVQAALAEVVACMFRIDH